MKSFLPQRSLLPLAPLTLTACSTFWSHTVVVVELLGHGQLFATPWTAAHQASLYFTISWSLFKRMSIEAVMPSNHFILCYPLLLMLSVFPSIRVFSSELALHIRWSVLKLQHQSFERILKGHTQTSLLWLVMCSPVSKLSSYGLNLYFFHPWISSTLQCLASWFVCTVSQNMFVNWLIFSILYVHYKFNG